MKGGKRYQRTQERPGEEYPQNHRFDRRPAVAEHARRDESRRENHGGLNENIRPGGYRDVRESGQMIGRERIVHGFFSSSPGGRRVRARSSGLTRRFFKRYDTMPRGDPAKMLRGSPRWPDEPHFRSGAKDNETNVGPSMSWPITPRRSKPPEKGLHGGMGDRLIPVEIVGDIAAAARERSQSACMMRIWSR